jgi:hypothetical protein
LEKIPITALGLAPRTFVNDIKADLFDANTVYVALDNHKEGDFSPYLFKSTDKGQTWQSISGNIPDRTLVWRMVQDPVKKNLLFAATEFGIYTSLNGGTSWQKLGGAPTISFRDLTIQKRENDLVAASFGRGFFVLDDYSALREFTEDNLSQKGKLFTPRTAKWFVPRSNIGNTGADYYFAKNPTYGAVFTYHLADEYQTAKEVRKEKETSLNKNNADIPFPGWDALDTERQEKEAQVVLSIQDSQGNVINKISQKASQGSHRMAWNFSHFNPYSISDSPSRYRGGGALAKPGTYQASLSLVQNGEVTPLDGPISFEVKALREGVLKGISHEEYNAYLTEITQVYKSISAVRDVLSESRKMHKAMVTALAQAKILPGTLEPKLEALKLDLTRINQSISGSPSRREVGERNPAGIQSFLSNAMVGLRNSYGPTPLHKKSLKIAKELLVQLRAEVKSISEVRIPEIEAALKAADAPYILGQGIE